MSVNFSSDPTAKGFFTPTRFEADVYDCEVIEGAIPSDLAGTFYRVGADWFYPPKFPDDSPFNADGYVSMFRFTGGSVDFKGRWVRTARWLADDKARRQLFGYYRNPFTDDPLAKGVDRGVANTNVHMHAGKLYALKEDSRALEIDPDTLETRSYDTFGGKYDSPTFTAHPKTDHATGEMITYGYEATGLASNALWIYWIDKAGHVTKTVKVQVPYVSMIHDIAITRDHILFPVYGMVTSMERLKAGKVHWGWDSKVPTYIGIIPRDGEAKDMRWFKGPERGIIHTFAANSENGKVTLEAPISDSNPFPFFPAVDGSPFNPAGGRTTVRRLTFDMNSKDDGYSEQIIHPNVSGALSRIDDRWMGRNYRYGYMGVNDPSRPFDEVRGGQGLKARVTNSYARFDFHTGEMTTYFAGPTHGLQECSFIPRKADSAEGDGYLVGVCSNYAERNSELVLVDAVGMEQVARVRMPFRVSNQIHGKWSPKGELHSRAV